MAVPLPLPALHASHAGIWLTDAAGHARQVDRGAAIAAAAASPHLLINAPLTGERLGYGELSGLDLLELFAFVHPARFAVPTADGLSAALGLAAPGDEAAIAAHLQQLASALFAAAAAPGWPERDGAWHGAAALSRQRWGWAPFLLDRLETPGDKDRWLFSRLPEWQDAPPRPAAKTITPDPTDVAATLARLTGSTAEDRPSQREYALTTAQIFAPRAKRGQPNIVIAEAGTGIGKTLGYLAPAASWIAASGGGVYVSTFTKALQRQLARETERLYPDRTQHRAKVVVRKGRENYLCLLNLEDALQGGFSGRAAILAQLVARWAAYSRDGDMVGGDLPGWLPALFRRNGTTALTDRRGECVYAACPHYRKCFIERSIRAAGDADIVIANHALTMVQTARPRDAAGPPQRIIFDEGHHLYEAADAIFAVALTGGEAIELRRWIIGPEGRARGRRRGLAARLADVASYDGEVEAAVQSANDAALALPGDGWLKRLADNQPSTPVETLLATVRAVVLARASSDAQFEAGYGLETELAEPDGRLVAAAAQAADALSELQRPLLALAQRLDAVIEEAPDWLDAQARSRIDGARLSLGTRCELIAAWLALLARVGGPSDPDFVDWLALDRVDGRELDCGLHRHWLDPMQPFARMIYEPAHGVLVTSATLRAGGSWADARVRTGTRHVDAPVIEESFPSPFDFRRQAEVLIVTDIARGDLAALAGAYARLIEAAGGGTLGLFSAIRRLRIVHARIADRLARAGLPLFAQHVDPLDTGTLVDIFRSDPAASLLGTDALRDGVDVPGDSLRLVVMESIPWPRPTVLHSARKLSGGGTQWDDMVVRARLAQAFGRLIRRADDRGQFVILSSAVPSRFLSAFPADTPILRLPLDQAVARVRAVQANFPAQATSAFPAS
ncbi:MAG: ATP-dependent DNA helicase [Sphingopyxis sp.]|nr:ATP-dependent DNA helicase [Sphingopyxis sp.]